jgi:cellulose synthase operon protein C
MTGIVEVHMAQKQAARASERLKQQIAKVPGDSDLYGLLGGVQMAMKDYAAAEQSFSQAVDLNQNSVDAILALTSVELARGSVDQAVASYRRAIEKNPRDQRPYLLLGSLEESQSKWTDAQQHYQMALAVQPDNPAAANNLAYLLLDHGGNVDVALSLAQTARRGLPNLANTADTLGWAYIKKGVYGLAVGVLQEAVNTAPANPTYHYHLGLAYQKNNDPAHAKAQFDRALQLSPPKEQTDEIRKALSEGSGD